MIHSNIERFSRVPNAPLGPTPVEATRTMRIALLSWESLHSIAVGGVAVHVTELAAALDRREHEIHVFTRQGQSQPGYAFVDGVLAVEDTVGSFDVVHAHDWLASNAAVWIKEGRGRKAVLTMHSTEYGRNGNRFLGG